MVGPFKKKEEYMLDRNKVVVGMSGGVDSSVAAYHLQKKGFDVIGVHMKLWKDGAGDLTSSDDARRICDKLGIPFYEIDFQDDFKEEVVNYFIDAYEKGETPNPCVVCNRKIKFRSLIEKATLLGAYYVATGHYANISYDEVLQRYVVQKSGRGKDQTYALYRLTQEQLSHMLTPLASYEDKEEVRRIAQTLDVNISVKKDSQEICFIPDNDYIGFLKKHASLGKKGALKDGEGNILATHEGISGFTIGQRKGLGVSLGYPAYVIDIDSSTGDVTVGGNMDTLRQSLDFKEANFVSISGIDNRLRCLAKIRYGAVPAPCEITREGNQYHVVFDEPQRAVTPGQSIVLYEDSDRARLLGGGVIIKK